MRRIVCLIAVGLLLAFTASATEIPTSLARVNEAEDARFRPDVGTIPVFGIPEWITDANRKWLDLYQNALIDRGEIKTGGKGRVVLHLADGGKLRLGPNSNLILARLRQGKEPGINELELQRGELEWTAEQIKSEKRSVVRTATVVIEPEGSAVSVRHSKDKKTIVMALKGAVRVKRREAADTVVVSEGQQISVSKSGTGMPKPEPIK